FLAKLVRDKMTLTVDLTIFELMNLFHDLFNMRSVAIVGEYNAPFMSVIRNRNLSENER
ncbi:hypothetical protein IWW36_004147, partial [Coemansia brasiliensis]